MSGPSRTPAPTGCENGATAGQTEGQTPAPTRCMTGTAVGQIRDERGMMEGTELREKKK